MVHGDSHLKIFSAAIISFIGLHHFIDNVIFISSELGIHSVTEPFLRFLHLTTVTSCEEANTIV